MSLQAAEASDLSQQMLGLKAFIEEQRMCDSNRSCLPVALQVAPYNTFYPRLDAHLAEVGVDPSVNLWNVPVALGKTDPHDPNLPTAGAADAESETASLLPPERFVPFVVIRLS